MSACKCIVASDGKNGVILYPTGDLAGEVAECSPFIDDYAELRRAKPGISVWEGRVEYIGSAEDALGFDLIGQFRMPTEEETDALAENRKPW